MSMIVCEESFYDMKKRLSKEKSKKKDTVSKYVCALPLRNVFIFIILNGLSLMELIVVGQEITISLVVPFGAH